jgi:hypothetical protein
MLLPLINSTISIQWRSRKPILTDDFGGDSLHRLRRLCGILEDSYPRVGVSVDEPRTDYLFGSVNFDIGGHPVSGIAAYRFDASIRDGDRGPEPGGSVPSTTRVFSSRISMMEFTTRPGDKNLLGVWIVGCRSVAIFEQSPDRPGRSMRKTNHRDDADFSVCND